MIYFNGKFVLSEAVHIDPVDRGFLLGDGLFETMRVYQGRVFCLKEHWQRLTTSANYLEIPFTITELELQKIIDELLENNNLSAGDASLRLTLTRGTGPRGLLPSAEIKPTVMLAVSPLLARAQAAVSVQVVDIRRNELSPLANHKSLNYLDNVLARMAAVKAGADEAILLNSKNHVAEASAANIFLVTSQGQLLTPPLTDGVLPGIVRQVVIELAREFNIPVAQHSVSIADLYQAQEIFLTNSLIEIQPVKRVNQRLMGEINSAVITRKLQAAYRHCERPTHLGGKYEKRPIA